MGTGEWSIKLGEWLGHYSRMQKLKAVRWEHFGIGLGLNFELVFATVKSRRQVTSQVWSSGQILAQSRDLGAGSSGKLAPTVGGPEFQAEDLKGKGET